jgi:hypothetical protein
MSKQEGDGNMKKKNRGKYRYRRCRRIEEEAVARRMWELLVKEVKNKIGMT